MNDVAIRVEGLGKLYRLGKSQQYKSLRETLTQTFTAPIRGVRRMLQGTAEEPRNGDTIWALKDVSFEIKHGEAIGVIGRNGAGKSTLLKILSRITEPTEGEAKIYGRVGSLLEIGTGFHPELTGRENIYLNGSILGMKRHEIERKFDEIVGFAEIDKFLDTQVKHFSTGMQVRLAFAVAAHLEPEILVVDEVLAVGDSAFQKKCLGKMSDVASEGRTVLLVSHNMTAVRSLCQNAIWLESGRIAAQGSVGAVISEYIKTASSSCIEQVWPDLEGAPGNDMVRLHKVSIQALDDTSLTHITVDTPIQAQFLYWNLVPNSKLNLSIQVFNQEGACVFASTSVDEPSWDGKLFPCGLFKTTCSIPAGLLNDGVYRILLLVVKNRNTILYRHEDVLVFEVHDSMSARAEWYGKWLGIVRPRLKWETDLLEESVAELSS
jgi:homopolymeric O-antigen transport system ATP-binding protein